MPFSVHRFATLIGVLAVLSCLLTLTEAKLRLPYTTPVIRTNHSTVVDLETGKVVAAFPVNFTVAAAGCFANAVELMNGSYLSGATVVQTHIFTGANMSLVFDVLNPGLDFVMQLTSDEYPVLQDQYGSLWKPVAPLKLEVIKRETKYTYNVGSVGMTSYQSQSESVMTLAGELRYDPECHRTKACCSLNTTNYRKYALVDSPVPPYACTDRPLTYDLANFSFEVTGSVACGGVVAASTCGFSSNEASRPSVRCSSKELLMDSVRVSPPYSTPSSGYALCRRGSSLTDPSYESSPIPVVCTGFCSTKCCLGYTAKNYMKDRANCLDYPLGHYTSQDGNNTNQFSFYESAALGYWQVSFRGLSWIDDVGMSSSTTVQNISFQRDVPASRGWSLVYANFPLPLTDTLRPLFPIGRPTRVSARFNDATSPTAIVVTVEYVSFSNFTGANWTIQTCVAAFCGASEFPAAAASSRYPTLAHATVHLSSLGPTRQLLPSEVVVTVTCRTTPTANPFHTLLQASRVAVEAAIKPSATQTVNASLAREPLQNVPSPYAASLGAHATSRIICQGDYRFSTVTGACVPLTDGECAVKYRGRRTIFNTTTRACFCQAPRLTRPLEYRPLPDPLPPPKFTEENIRALMKSLKLPQFLQTMERSIEVHDATAKRQRGRPAQAKRDASLPTEAAKTATAKGLQSSVKATAAAADTSAAPATSDADFSLPEGYDGFYELCIVYTVVACVAWVFIIFRDVIYKMCGVGLWANDELETKQRPAPWHTPASASPAAETPATQPWAPLSPLPAHPTPTASTSRAAAQPQTLLPDEGNGAEERSSARKSNERVKAPTRAMHSARAAATPAPRSPASPDTVPQPLASDVRQHRQSSAPQMHHRSDKANCAKPRRHASHDGRPPCTPRRTAPVWEGAPSAAHVTSPQRFAAGQHTPFGYTNGDFAPGDASLRDGYTRRSGGYAYVPAPHAFAVDQEGQRWYGFTATPSRTPPTAGDSRRSRGLAEDFFARSPSYAHAPSMHEPFNPLPYATAHSMQSGQPSPFGAEQYPARSPVRQSSRVEVLSADTDEARSDHCASAKARTHRLESID
ncbi:hypothetical protein ABL78_4420 [Leptomonas seymouri]|uniref:Generative cell specific-1/HAP2 domain-containing protein n=1 Tax=Leptomonas seymouri TaxID=5684 RepID=A0A0N1HY83_LEPSE|nr:hypothetical protein ABL78_4420 [Leptomonas seymouri]|eukprot:KPI86518.1 hypothetical protein ABL78_4420 [Leptomonas seymouri]